jgi:hypothetical protein
MIVWAHPAPARGGASRSSRDEGVLSDIRIGAGWHRFLASAQTRVGIPAFTSEVPLDKKATINMGVGMMKITSAVIGMLLTLPVSLPAHAITCAQQAQVCARIAKERGQPQYAPKCLASARIAECRKTCVWTGTDGRQFPANGDCKPR